MMEYGWPGRVVRGLAAAACALLAAAPPLAAQYAAPAREGPGPGSVTGTVLVAATGQPLPGAVVMLETAADRTGDLSIATAPAQVLSSVTDGAGAYRFANLPPGTYRLVVRHLGFHQAIVDVDLAGGAPFQLSIALVVNPIRLEPMDVSALTLEPYGRLRTASDELVHGGLDAEAWRDDRFLEGDATVLTHADVTQAVTFGESDLFRALQRMPGVSTRDDFTAALWTRGAPWGQTRVYFDGQPLFNPVHGIGLFAGVNPDAVGAATFHPGVRSSAIGEGAAGVFDVHSRRAGSPGVRGLAEVSMVSAHAAGEWGSPGGRSGLTIAARRSYVDMITRLAESLGADSGMYVPYAFYDITARGDADLGGGYAIEASGLVEQDGVDGPVRDLLRATTGHWGNRLGRVTLLTPLLGWRARHTIGVSAFDGTVDPMSPSARAEVVPSHGRTRNSVDVVSLATEVAPKGNVDWSFGLQFSGQRQHYEGQFPRNYPVVVLDTTLVTADELGVLSVWGERRIPLGSRAALEGGLRLDMHQRVLNAPPVGVAPKLALRATPVGSHVTFTAAAERSWQYTQALAPAGPSVGPDLYLTDVWLLAGDTIPAVRADVATLGVEAWLGGSWLAAVNGYARHATGMAVPEPGAGTLTPQRPIFVSADNHAHGFEVSLRRLAGLWTMAGSWSYGVSDLDARSAMFPVFYHYPSSADRRHSIDLSAMRRLGPVHLGGAVTWSSGAPFSRFRLGPAACDTLQAALCTPDTTALYIESPNAERTPAYASVDLMMDWSHTIGSVQLGAYLQVRNVLNLANAVTYLGSVTQCTTPDPPTLVAVGGGVCDRFDRGVPIMPLVGVRAAF
jgi:carboxypeptidase family protein/TonB-dependent receptor-like protein